MDIPLSSLVFTKPKKCGEYLVCKLEKKSEMVIQFPKMIIKSFTSKNIELEFQNDNVYTKKVYNHLSELDQFVIDYIFKNSEEWFGKEIPLDSINIMYNKFIKAPRTSESRCFLNLSIAKTSEFMDKLEEPLTPQELKENSILESIAKLKYLVFSKDTAFFQWEIVSAKMTTKVSKVKSYGFIEDPEDTYLSDSDSELEINSFF